MEIIPHPMLWFAPGDAGFFHIENTRCRARQLEIPGCRGKMDTGTGMRYYVHENKAILDHAG